MKQFLLLFIISFPLFHFAQTECIDPSIIDEDLACFFIYDPVCGCDGVTYSNSCVALNYNGVTEWVNGECALGNGDCNDLTGIDFGLCAMPLGIAYIDGTCQSISGCGYIVDEVNYSGDFFEILGDCESSCATGSECLELGGIDFGDCDFPLGVCLIDGICVSISGCDYVVDEVDYTNNFFDDLESCQDMCEEVGCIDPDQIDLSVFCPSIYDPVCGCDGITYGNSCEAFYFGGVTEYTDGECGVIGSCFDVVGIDFGPCDMELGFAMYGGGCQSVSGCDYTSEEVDYSNAFYTTISDCILSCEDLDCYEPDIIDLEVACIEIYDPVCGCDGVTYSNSCEALNYFGITEWTPGACGTSNCVDLNGIDFGDCEAFLGVGLIDGQCTGISGCGYVVESVDYSGSFYMDLESCEEACEDCIYDYIINYEIICDDLWQPVCGCDSITYVNECDAYYYNGVSSWTDGPCGSPADCINEDVVDPIDCYEILDPVCGCDGVTYDNDCFAFVAGVQSWVSGPCIISIDEVETLTFDIYPNPVGSILTINPGNYNGIYSFVIHDASGRDVLISRNYLGKATVDLSDLAGGYYVIQTINATGISEYYRILKK